MESHKPSLQIDHQLLMNERPQTSAIRVLIIIPIQD